MPRPLPHTALQNRAPGRWQGGGASPFVFLSGGPPLAMSSPPFPPRTSAPARSHVTKALGTVPSAHPVEGAYALIFVVPPTLKTHFQNYILESAASWSLCPPLLPGAGALTVSSCEGQLLTQRVKPGGCSNQPGFGFWDGWGSWRGPQCERVSLSSGLSMSLEPSSLLSCDTHC